MKFKVIETIRLDGVKYRPGFLIDLDEAQAQAFTASIRPLDEDEESTASVAVDSLSGQEGVDENVNQGQGQAQEQAQDANSGVDVSFQSQVQIEGQDAQENAQDAQEQPETQDKPKTGLFGSLFGGNTNDVLNQVQP